MEVWFLEIWFLDVWFEWMFHVKHLIEFLQGVLLMEKWKVFTIERAMEWKSLWVSLCLRWNSVWIAPKAMKILKGKILGCKRLIGMSLLQKEWWVKVIIGMSMSGMKNRLNCEWDECGFEKENTWLWKVEYWLHGVLTVRKFCS